MRVKINREVNNKYVDVHRAHSFNLAISKFSARLRPKDPAAIIPVRIGCKLGVAGRDVLGEPGPIGISIGLDDGIGANTGLDEGTPSSEMVLS